MFDEETLKYLQIFHPDLLEIYLDVQKNHRCFVHYTSAATAMKIIKNGELWFRNAMVMNDFSEIAYGLDLIRRVFADDVGGKFRDAVENLFEGTIEQARSLLDGWESDWRLETYLACVSMHDQKEDARGRLSMWRAYGDTALVINNVPMLVQTDLLAVYSIPVRYLSESDLATFLQKITDQIQNERDFLLQAGQPNLLAFIHQLLFTIAIATKHQGFDEEKEWRLYYRPNERVSPVMTEEVVVLGGIPQRVFKLRLANEPKNGLFGADVPSLLDRVIVGPTEFPYVSRQAFAAVLKGIGVENAFDKVIVSDIPLRTK